MLGKLEIVLIKAKITEHLQCDLLIGLLLKSSLASDQFPIFLSDFLIRALSEGSTSLGLDLYHACFEPCLRMVSDDSENLYERIKLYCPFIVLLNVSNLQDVLLEVELKQLFPLECFPLLNPGLIR